MTFKHRLFDLPDLEATTTPEGRYYSTPVGRLPSVTTVLGQHFGIEWLTEWKRRVGEEEARRVGTRARLRGTAVHELAEKYLMNDPEWRAAAMPVHLDSFLSIKRELDERVGTVFAVEAPLWSERLRTAGRTDCVAEWDGLPSIVDFKTSKKKKNPDEIFSYFIQEGCYAEMVRERTGLLIPQIVTVMMVDHDSPIVFVRKTEEYEDDVERVFAARRRDEDVNLLRAVGRDESESVGAEPRRDFS